MNSDAVASIVKKHNDDIGHTTFFPVFHGFVVFNPEKRSCSYFCRSTIVLWYWNRREPWPEG